MRSYGPERIHNVGLFGHGGSGKTTLVESLLLTSHGITRAGRVEDGNTVSDYDPDEQKRRMSINLSTIPLEWNDDKINLLDAPGYSDFVGDMTASMRVLDGAIIVMDASGGVEVGTELAWDLAVRAGVPRMIFINKLDRENANFFRCVEEAREKLDASIIPMQIPIGLEKEFRGIISLRQQRAWMICPKHDGSYEEADVPPELEAQMHEWRTELIDKIAAANDDLIEKYLEHGEDALTREELLIGLRAGIANGSIVPVFCGSATQLAGMAQLLNGIVDSFSSAGRKEVKAVDLALGSEINLQPKSEQPLSALVFKTLADPYGKISYLRVYSGSIHANSTVYNSRTRKDERIGNLYLIKGKEQTAVQEIGPGDIGIATKLADTLTNDTLCTSDHSVQLEPIQFPQPNFTSRVKPHTRSDQDKLGTALHRMIEEDPTLHTSRDTHSGETLLSGLGESHLAIVAERMKRKFDVSIDLALPSIPYRETIRGRAEAQYRHKKQTGGAGQFADVSIRIEPLEPDLDREDTLEFVNNIVGGVISRSFIPAVEAGVREAMAEGLLSGNPIVDVKVTLYDGKEHPVDSKEIAFKSAANQAFKIAAAKAQPIIMEPIYQLNILVPDQYAGDIMSDVNTRRGRVMGMMPYGNGKTQVQAHVPLSECQRYVTDLRSITQGRGNFAMVFDHYEDVPAHMIDNVVSSLKKEHAV